MDCARARSLLHPWLDGELPKDDHRDIVEHLGACEQCDARFKDEQRLVARVKTGLAAECPRELKARLFAQIAATPPVVARGSIIGFRRAAAAAAVFVVAFVWTDPLCIRGCPTVRALAFEHHAATANVGSFVTVAEQVTQRMGEPLGECTECQQCIGLSCFGWDPVTVCKRGCMVRFKDRAGHAISFVKLKDGHVHEWLQIRAGDGLIVTRQDGCRFTGWKDSDGGICGFVSDESMDEKELVAIAERVRGH